MEMSGAAHDHPAGHHMAPPTSEDVDLWDATSYWSLKDHVSLMYAHIAIMIIAWVIILPMSESRLVIESTQAPIDMN